MTVPPRRRVWARLGLALVALLVAAAAGASLAYPAVAATACPACVGLDQAAPGVYVEAGVPRAERDRVVAAVAEGERRVEAFYRGRRTDPRVLVCLTERCHLRVGGGGQRGVAVLNRAVLLSPRGADATIAAHELSHVELHARLDSPDLVPQWFDEGLAVVVADDRRFLKPAGSADRCVEEPGNVTRVRSLAQWPKGTAEGERAYGRAACAVSRWIAAEGGNDAVVDLVARLNAGTSFNTLVPA